MELWVRSQDREELIKINHRLFILQDKSAYVIKVDLCINDGFIDLGTYKTKERALEVLDEIQKTLFIDLNITGTYQENDLNIKSNILVNMVKVFIMPEE